MCILCYNINSTISHSIKKEGQMKIGIILRQLLKGKIF